MGKDNTGLIIIGAVAAFFFLMPKETRQQILPSGGGVTSLDLGGITTALSIPELGETDIGLPGISELQQQAQAALFNIQFQGMKAAFDLQLAGLKNLIPNLPTLPQSILPEINLPDILGGGGGGFNIPTVQEIIGAVTGNLPGFPDITDQGKTEGGKDDKWGTTPYFFRMFGEHAISESGVYQDFMSLIKGVFPGGEDGRDDSPEANQKIPILPKITELPTIDIARGFFKSRYFLGDTEISMDTAKYLYSQGFQTEELKAEPSEIPVSSEGAIDIAPAGVTSGGIPYGIGGTWTGGYGYER